jgi:hypothetical protein
MKENNDLISSKLDKIETIKQNIEKMQSLADRQIRQDQTFYDILKQQYQGNNFNKTSQDFSKQ